MLPSTRELELETLLRSRDVHISNLTVRLLPPYLIVPSISNSLYRTR